MGTTAEFKHVCYGSAAMVYNLSSNQSRNNERRVEVGEPPAYATTGMADLKVFWGPEICRLEYLIHLLETGRIKDPYWHTEAAASVGFR